MMYQWNGMYGYIGPVQTVRLHIVWKSFYEQSGYTVSRTSSSKWRRLRLEVLERDDGICRIGLDGCEGIATEVDHILPVSRGGGDNRSNLRAACRRCNRSLSNPRQPSRQWVR